MAYTPPVGVADLALAGSYTPPVGTADLLIGYDPSLNRLITGAGEALEPTGLLRIGHWFLAQASGELLAPIGRLEVAYDPNLLSAVHGLRVEHWQGGTVALAGLHERLQSALALHGSGLDHWQAAESLPDATISTWQDSERLAGAGGETWQAADFAANSTQPFWQSAAFVAQSGEETWQEATAASGVTQDTWRDLPRIEVSLDSHWQDGRVQSLRLDDPFSDGRFLLQTEVEIWQQAGYPGNAANPQKDAIPGPIKTPWGTALKLVCPLPGTALKIGRVPCILIAEREIAVRSSYMSVNSASLVRWPDLTPLPCTSMTLETDFDSWCWALSATLAGPDAWALVQPNPLACEVLATINGQAWKFLLDVPSTNRAFNSDQVTLKGRSRSAWLHDPYTPSRDFSEVNAREMQQLGEAALDNTGWTLNWQGENWVVPAGRYNSWNTPIGVLMRLANTTDDGVYTDPDLQVMTLQKRWPVASWLIEGEVVDVLIPDAAIISLSQSPVYSQPMNGVYVSGTSHGVLALVKIAGTDGALQPAEPLTNELLCDTEGVAARQRGLNALSDSGSGFTMDAETLFNPPTFPLVPPGLIVSIAGMKGVSRSVKISAQWSSGLQVKQSIGLERREVES